MTVLVHQSWLPRYIGAKSCSSFTVTRGPRFKASDLPFTLATGLSSQASSRSSLPWSHDSMSCLICNELLHHHIITCGLISCESHINIISPPKLSLNYQNQTRTFHPPSTNLYIRRCPPTTTRTKNKEFKQHY